MTDAVTAARWQFAFTIMFHYLFPILTMGLGTLIVILKTAQLYRHDDSYGRAARFWAKIFAVNFALGVVTGIPMEFQFGTNWGSFSHYSGGVVGQTLFMEGVFAFFAESSFLGMFLLGEKRLSPRMHWLSSVMVAGGAVVSGFFITITDAWMQHPVGHTIVTLPDGTQRAQLDSVAALLTNPYGHWQYLHTLMGAFTTGSMVMAGIGAYYLLKRKHEDFGRLSVKLGVVSGAIFAVLQLMPTGSFNAENVARYQKPKLAAIEGIFETQSGAPLSLVGVPDTEAKELKYAIRIPKLLSLLAYGDPNAEVMGLNDVDSDEHPPVPIVFYAYHIMIGLGMAFIGLLLLGVLLLWRKALFTSRWYLALLVIAIPFPYIANQAGWVVAEVGRQPWVIWGLMRTPAGVSRNVSAGQMTFSLVGFVLMYALMSVLFVVLVGKIIAKGPDAAVAAEVAK